MTSHHLTRPVVATLMPSLRLEILGRVGQLTRNIAIHSVESRGCLFKSSEPYQGTFIPIGGPQAHGNSKPPRRSTPLRVGANRRRKLVLRPDFDSYLRRQSHERHDSR